MIDVPGYEFAIKHGYTLHSYNGQRTSATYVKGDVFLVIQDNGDAYLEKIIGLVECKLVFRLPNEHFEQFERSVQRIRDVALDR